MARRGSKKSDGAFIIDMLVFIIEILCLIWCSLKGDSRKTAIFWKVLGGTLGFLVLLSLIEQSLA